MISTSILSPDTSPAGLGSPAGESLLSRPAQAGSQIFEQIIQDISDRDDGTHPIPCSYPTVASESAQAPIGPDPWCQAPGATTPPPPEIAAENSTPTSTAEGASSAPSTPGEPTPQTGPVAPRSEDSCPPSSIRRAKLPLGSPERSTSPDKSSPPSERIATEQGSLLTSSSLEEIAAQTPEATTKEPSDQAPADSFATAPHPISYNYATVVSEPARVYIEPDPRLQAPGAALNTPSETRAGDNTPESTARGTYSAPATARKPTPRGGPVALQPGDSSPPPPTPHTRLPLGSREGSETPDKPSSSSDMPIAKEASSLTGPALDTLTAQTLGAATDSSAAAAPRPIPFTYPPVTSASAQASDRPDPWFQAPEATPAAPSETPTGDNTPKSTARATSSAPANARELTLRDGSAVHQPADSTPPPPTPHTRLPLGSLERSETLDRPSSPSETPVTKEASALTGPALATLTAPTLGAATDSSAAAPRPIPFAYPPVTSESAQASIRPDPWLQAPEATPATPSETPTGDNTPKSTARGTSSAPANARELTLRDGSAVLQPTDFSPQPPTPRTSPPLGSWERSETLDKPSPPSETPVPKEASSLAGPALATLSAPTLGAATDSSPTPSRQTPFSYPPVAFESAQASIRPDPRSQAPEATPAAPSEAPAENSTPTSSAPATARELTLRDGSAVLQPADSSPPPSTPRTRFPLGSRERSQTLNKPSSPSDTSVAKEASSLTGPALDPLTPPTLGAATNSSPSPSRQTPFSYPPVAFESAQASIRPNPWFQALGTAPSTPLETPAEKGISVTPEASLSTNPVVDARAAQTLGTAAVEPSDQSPGGTGPQSIPAAETPLTTANETWAGRKTTGMADAKMPVMMNELDNPSQNRRTTEQNLPGAGGSAGKRSGGDAPLPFLAARPADDQFRALNTYQAAKPDADATALPGQSFTATTQLHPITTPEIHTAPRTQDSVQAAILDQVVQIRQIRAQELAVVVKTDQGSELFLHLRQHNGQVEIHARCEHGNTQLLHQQWSELQSALARHGVSLAPLNEQSGSRLASANAPIPQPQPGAGDTESRRQPRHPSKTVLEDLPMVGSVTEPLKPRPTRGVTTSRRGWESWA